MDGSALTTEQLEKSQEAIEALEAFNEIPNASMVKDLKDLLVLGPASDTITKEETERWERLSKDLGGIARRVANTWVNRAETAEIILAVVDNEDYKVLKSKDTMRPYRHWTEFKPHLANAIGMSVRTVDNYIKLVRVGQQVLNIPPGAFAEVSGVLTVGHVLDRCTGHGRSGPKSDYADKLRPKTTDFRQEMNKRYPDEDFDVQLAAYFWQDVAHDIRDSSAVNKTPGELADHGRQMDGAPKIFVRELYNEDRMFVGYTITMQYRDTTELDGSTLTGDQDIYNLILEGDFMAPAVRDWIAKRFNMA